MKRKLSHLCISVLILAFGLTACQDLEEEKEEEQDNRQLSVSISGTNKVGNLLTANVNATGFKDSDATTYQWKRNGTNIQGATQRTYTLAFEDSGANITVTVRKGGKTATSATPISVARAVLDIVNLHEFNTLLGGDVWVEVYSDAPDFDSREVTYQWLRNGTAIQGATNAIYIIAAEDIGKRISVMIDYDGEIVITDSFTGGDDKPYLGVQLGAWNHDIGGNIYASIYERNLDDGPVTIQWKRDGEVIPGAIGREYSTGPEDAGKKITVTVSKGGKEATSTPFQVASQGVILNFTNNTVDENGMIRFGQTLNVDVTRIGISDDIPVLWVRKGLILDGVTGETYTLQEEDENCSIAACVSTNDFAFYSETLYVPQRQLTGNIIGRSDPYDLYVGETLSVDVIKNFVVDGATVQYKWQATKEGVSTVLSTSSTYTLQEEDRMKNIELLLTYADKTTYMHIGMIGYATRDIDIANETGETGEDIDKLFDFIQTAYNVGYMDVLESCIDGTIITSFKIIVTTDKYYCSEIEGSMLKVYFDWGHYKSNYLDADLNPDDIAAIINYAAANRLSMSPLLKGQEPYYLAGKFPAKEPANRPTEDIVPPVKALENLQALPTNAVAITDAIIRQASQRTRFA